MYHAQTNPLTEGVVWITKCLLLFGIIAIGGASGHLQETCIAGIVIFVAVQGLLPFLRCSREVNVDRQKSELEAEQLENIPGDLGEQLHGMDTAGAGSLLKIAVVIQRTEGRMSKSEAIDGAIGIGARRYQKLLTPTENAAEQAPLLGLGGSLIGIMGSLAEMATAEADTAGLFSSMATMVSTTLTGCAGALVLIGLATIARNAVESHLAWLRATANQLFGDDGENDETDDDFESLF